MCLRVTTRVSSILTPISGSLSVGSKTHMPEIWKIKHERDTRPLLPPNNQCAIIVIIHSFKIITANLTIPEILLTLAIRTTQFHHPLKMNPLHIIPTPNNRSREKTSLFPRPECRDSPSHRNPLNSDDIPSEESLFINNFCHLATTLSALPPSLVSSPFANGLRSFHPSLSIIIKAAILLCFLCCNKYKLLDHGPYYFNGFFRQLQPSTTTDSLLELPWRIG